VYDFEKMEEIISEEDEQNIHIDVEDRKESSSSSSSYDINGDIVNKKSTNKMSHIILLSAAWCTNVKSRTKVGYYDMRDGEDFMAKQLKLLIEVAAEVECDNRYACID
jgi:hypothetical protein